MELEKVLNTMGIEVLVVMGQTSREDVGEELNENKVQLDKSKDLYKWTVKTDDYTVIIRETGVDGEIWALTQCPECVESNVKHRRRKPGSGGLENVSFCPNCDVEIQMGNGRASDDITAAMNVIEESQTPSVRF